MNKPSTKPKNVSAEKVVQKKTIEESILNPNILSIDIGNSRNKVGALINGSTTYIFQRDYAVQIPIERDFNNNVDDYVLLDNGKTQEAWSISDDSYVFQKGDGSNLLILNDYETFKKQSILSIKKYIKHSSFKGAIWDKVVVVISPAYKDKLTDYHSYLVSNLPEIADKIDIVFQGKMGAGAYLYFGDNIDKPNPDSKVDNFACLDIGMNTIDFTIVKDRKVYSETTIGHEGQGVILAVKMFGEELKKVAGHIPEDFFSLPKLKEIFDKGVLTFKGVETAYSNLKKDAIMKYLDKLREIFNNDPDFKTPLNNATKVLFIGGGAEIIKQYFDEWKERNKDANEGYFVIPEKPSLYNVAGALELTKRRLMRSK